VTGMLYGPKLGGGLEQISAPDGTVYNKHGAERIWNAAGVDGSTWQTYHPQDDIGYRTWLASGGNGTKEDWISEGRPSGPGAGLPVRRPYSEPKKRPKYAEGQVDAVWEAAMQPDGNVYDPNTGELLTWDKTKSRAGQWDGIA